MKYSVVIILSILLFGVCTSTENTTPIDIQGLPGARGLYPENNIEGFLFAIDIFQLVKI